MRRTNYISFEKFVSGLPGVLSPEQESCLLHRIRDGNQIARQEFLVHNIRLVAWAAFNIADHTDIGSFEVEDLIGEGILGLEQALNKWDYRPGKFSTYATYWIRHSIRRAISTRGHAVRCSIGVMEDPDKRQQRDLIVRSLDEALSEDSDECMADVLYGGNVEEEALQNCVSEDLKFVLDHLVWRERESLKTQLGIGLTRYELAQRMGVTLLTIDRFAGMAMEHIRSDPLLLSKVEGML